MTTQYTPTLKLALPVTGELSGTWGDVVNDNITSMIEQAIAGLSTINTWTANAHTLTTANGTTSESRCAMLVAATGAGGTALTGAGEIICPAAAKLYVVQNTTAFVVTLKTSAGTGVAVAAGNTAFLFCDGTNVNSCVTTIVDGRVTGNLTVDGNATINGNTTLGNATSDTITATARFASVLAPSVDNTYDLGSSGNSWKDLYIDGTAFIGTIDLTNLEVTNIKAKDGTASITIADTTGIATFSKATVVETTDNTNAALRITQLGTGNALLVEDSTNPDSTPFAITATGAVLVATTTAKTTGVGSAVMQIFGGTAPLSFYREADSTTPINLEFAKARAAGAILASGDTIGRLYFSGSDGTAQIPAAYIDAAVDGTPGTNDMPGRLVFSTTADGSSTPTTRLTIYSDGSIQAGASQSPSYNLRVGRNITGATTGGNFWASGTVQSDVTSNGYGFLSEIKTAAASFVLSSAHGFRATQGTIGAGSSITNQYGFNADSTLTGATNNYGFYGSLAAAANTYNFYANGTATNFFGGNTIISVTDNTNAALRITQLGTGNALLVEDASNPDTTPFVIDSTGGVIRGTTTAIASNLGTGTLQSIGSDVNSSALTTLGMFSSTASRRASLEFIKSATNTIGTQAVVVNNETLALIQASGSDGTAFISAATIAAFVDGTPGTNDMPGRLVFSTTADGASSPTERMRIDSAGQVSIGGTPTAGVSVYLRKNVTGGTTSYGLAQNVQIQSDVTSNAGLFNSTFSTAASAFTLTNVSHFAAGQGTIGAGSAITNQYGFNATNSLTGATNNYGFYGNLASASNVWNLYMAGTAANYFAGQAQFANGSVGTPSISNINDTNTGIFFPAADTIAFSEGGVESMRINASGDLYLGATTGARGGATTRQLVKLGTGQSYVEIQSASTSSTSDGLMFSDGSTGNYGLVEYNHNVDAMNFYTASSSRMRIDSSGNVGIGTSSPAAKLDVAVGGGPTIRLSNTTSNSTTGELIGALDYYSADADNPAVRSYIRSYFLDVFGRDSYLTFATTTTGGNAIERMRIDSSGNVGIGTVSPTYRLEVATAGQAVLQIKAGTTTDDSILGFGDSAANLQGRINYSHSIDAMGIYTNGSERARIDSSGRLLVGTTSTTGIAGNGVKITSNAVGSTSTVALTLEGTGGDFYALKCVGTDMSLLSTASGGANSWSFISPTHTPLILYSNGEVRMPTVYGKTVTTPRNMFIDSNGVLGGISSVRASKNNITPITDSAWLYQVSPVTFNYRKRDEDGNYLDEVESETQYGLIAEDVEAVKPEFCIYVEKDGQQVLQGVHYDRMISPLIKALQEQQAIITQLQADVAALKNPT